MRREDPEKALDAVLSQTPLSVITEGADLNATEWNGADDRQALHNPFVEGFAHVEGLVTVLGFTDGHGLVRNKPNRVADQLKDSSIMPERDVSISGIVNPEQLLFLVLRVPVQFVSREELTEKEKVAHENGVQRYIFRGVLLNSKPEERDIIH